ncbi:START domain-containing protein [Marinilabilia sp.]
MSKTVGLLLILFSVIPFFDVAAEEGDWQLRKNENGIKVYTRQKEDAKIYMYKVVTQISVKPETVYRQVVDFNENLKHMELVDSLRFLDHQKDKRYTNYMHFNMPWPVKNREMVMEMLVTKDQDSIYLESNDVPDYLSKNSDIVLIEDFQEKWIIKKGASPDESQIIVTGWVDPGGSIPMWVVNLFSAQTPFRFISGILQEVKKDL